MPQAKTMLRFEELKENLSGETLENIQNKFVKELRDNESQDVLDRLTNSDWQRINDLATDEGQEVLIQTCQQFEIDSFDYLNMTPSDLATMVFITNLQAFISAENLCNIDSVDKFSDYKGAKVIQPNHSSLEAIEEELEQYFASKGKGKKVKIESYSFANRIVYFVKYGERIKDVSILEEDNFQSRKLRLSREVILIFYPNRKLLRVKAPTKILKSLLVNNFARHILKDENYFINSEHAIYYNLKKVFELDNFEQTLNPDEVESVVLKELTVENTSEGKSKITFSCNNVLRQLEDTESKIEHYRPIKAKIQFKLKDFGKSNNRTIEIATPNISNLNDTDRDDLIMTYLTKWRIALSD